MASTKPPDSLRIQNPVSSFFDQQSGHGEQVRVMEVVGRRARIGPFIQIF